MRVTLAGFAAADMSVTRGAAALHVHENTLRYRLRSIHQRTGYDPRSFEGLLELLCLMDVLDTEQPIADDPQRYT
jgi:sugar diacid utilization regulator